MQYQVNSDDQANTVITLAGEEGSIIKCQHRDIAPICFSVQALSWMLCFWKILWVALLIYLFIRIVCNLNRIGVVSSVCQCWAEPIISHHIVHIPPHSFASGGRSQPCRNLMHSVVRREMSDRLVQNRIVAPSEDIFFEQWNLSPV